MKPDELTWNELAAALCKAGVIPWDAIDDADDLVEARHPWPPQLCRGR